ncbi:Ger(x)C family spore germination protein [Robertmurraya massiliosenegalensis]|uniref:Ger(x)C family spore germination protein n=1 Tax=Robertmurraya massiliosenegalensis TaxID=1287657 RepID=UPI000555F3C7|nr:Ger(x)C family spore germination protein [Robertmurraya massiliosenegalensis]
MKSRLALSIFMICSILLTGCTGMGKRELNELALVMAVGLDKGEKEGNIKITAQVVRPADAIGQTGAPAGNTGEPIWSASAEGETIFEAIRNLSTFSSRRVFWAHNHVIVINEDLAKEGIRDIIDFFTRNPELRMRTWVTVTPEKASEVVSTLTGLEVVPGSAIDRLFWYSSIAARSPRTEILDLQAAYLSESSEPVLARLKLINRGISNKKPGEEGALEQVELSGAGVFKGDKLVGILGDEEARGLLYFIENPESGVVSLKCPKDETKKVSIELRKQNVDVIPKYKNKHAEFEVNLQAYGSLVEAGCEFSMDDDKSVEQLEEELSSYLKEQIIKVVDKVQNEYKSDILELGKVFNNRYPIEWKEIRSNWEQELQEAKITVHVEAEITDGALLFKPTKKH